MYTKESKQLKFLWINANISQDLISNSSILVVSEKRNGWTTAGILQLTFVLKALLGWKLMSGNNNSPGPCRCKSYHWHFYLPENFEDRLRILCERLGILSQISPLNLNRVALRTADLFSETTTSFFDVALP